MLWSANMHRKCICEEVIMQFEPSDLFMNKFCSLGYCKVLPFKLLQYSMLVTDNLSYGATVGASAANSNLIKSKT